MVSLSLPVPPKTDPKQHLREVGYSYPLLLGLFLHSVLPPFMEVPKNKTLAEPGMQRMTRGVQELQLHHPTAISSASAQLLPTGNCNQALNSGPQIQHNTPNTADHRQPKPTSNSHLLNNFIQPLVLSQQAGRPGWVPALCQHGWAELNPESWWKSQYKTPWLQH